MDDRGFIFTADASLALIVIMIATASIAAYIMAPYFMGQEHEHLQALASDALENMEQDGTLYTAATKYNQGNVTGANELLNDRLSLLIPTDTAYNLTMMGHSVSNSSRVLIATDTATAVRVISGPNEGWLGRAWYKQEQVQFEQKQINVTSTVWNFHNYLTNFDPWGSYGFYERQYWGVTGSTRPGTPVNIPFSLPNDAVITGAMFLQGSNNESANNYNALSYGVDVNINGHHYGNTTPFTMLYPRVDGSGNIQYGLVYNYKGVINTSDLNAGSNYFNVYFNYQNLLRSNYDYTMPWFSIIANYTTSIIVPTGILSLNGTDNDFPDAAGLAKPSNAGGNYGKIFDLSTGTVTNLTTRRVLSWNTYSSNRNALDNYDDGIPFVFEDVNGGSSDGSAVSVVKEFNIPTGSRIFDGYVNVNAYGAVDDCLVEVWDGSQWRAVFCSFDFREIPGSSTIDFSAGDGYGNTPGTIFIGDKLHTGLNRVRITVWDNVPSNDYDLVGLVDSKVYASFSFLPIRWENFAFPSYQAGSQQTYTFPSSTGRAFTIGPEAQKAYLFMGTMTTARHITVQVSNATATWTNVYDSDTVPFMLDLGALDAAGPHRFTKGTAGNYTLNQGSGFRVRVIVTAPPSWQSGDGAQNPGTYGNPAIFSGTRVAIIYPKFLQNTWTTAYNSTADAAKAQAKEDLIRILQQAGFIVDPNVIQTEAIYAGDMPNAVPVRLDLWKQ
jgi:hypothetical protein